MKRHPQAQMSLSYECRAPSTRHSSGAIHLHVPMGPVWVADSENSAMMRDWPKSQSNGTPRSDMRILSYILRIRIRVRSDHSRMCTHAFDVSVNDVVVMHCAALARHRLTRWPGQETPKRTELYPGHHTDELRARKHFASSGMSDIRGPT